MKIEIACSCGKEYSVGPELLGEELKCEACGEMVPVEIGMAAAPPEPEPEEEPKKAPKAPRSKKKGTGRTARKAPSAGGKKAAGKKSSKKKSAGAEKASGDRTSGEKKAAGDKKGTGARKRPGKKATGGARRPPPKKKTASPAALLALVAGVGALVLGGVYLMVSGGNTPATADASSDGDAGSAATSEGSGTSTAAEGDGKKPRADGWVNHRPDDGGWDVLFPGAPSHRIDSFDTPAATSGSVKKYVSKVVADGGKVSYEVAYWDYPLEVPAHETFQEVEKEILRGVPEPRKNLSQSDRKHSQGSPGRELRVTAEFSGVSKSIVTYFYLVQKTRLIQLTVTSEQGAGSVPNSTQFLDSLQIFEWD